MKEKIRAWFSLPDCHNLRFTDFRMADDVQKNQQLIGLNAQLKVSDQTMLTELGYDWEQEQKRMIEEIYFQNYLNDLRAKGSAKTQGEASVISFNYQNKVQDLATKAQAQAHKRALEFTYGTANKLPEYSPQNQYGGQEAGLAENLANENAPADMNAPADPNASPGTQDPAQAAQQATTQAGNAMDAAQEQVVPGADQTVQGLDDMQGRVSRMATQLANMPPQEAKTAIQEIVSKFPDFGSQLNRKYNELVAGVVQTSNAPQDGGVNMAPMPEKGMPRRAGAV